MNYANELYELDYDIASASQPLLPELIHEKRIMSSDQRVHPRFQVHKDAFALIRPGHSEGIRVSEGGMAEIACAVYRSKPVRFGRIDTISMGGLSFRYIPGEERSERPLALDILVAESGFYLKNLPFKNISDVEIDDDLGINSFKMRLNRVQFEGLVPATMMELEHFVRDYRAFEV